MHGAPLVCASASAAAHFDAAVQQYLGLGSRPHEALQAAVDEDPQFVMAHAMRGLLAMMWDCAVADDDVVASSVRACTQLVARDGLGGRRERTFAAALMCWAARQPRRAAALLEGLLLEDPLDALAIRCLHDSYAFLGDAQNLRDSLARVLPRWQPTMLNYPRVLGMYAFGLAELGAHDSAEDMAMRTLHMDPSDAWAVHAVAHVMEAQGRRNEGTRVLREFSDHWEESAAIAKHLHWHWAQLSLEDSDMDMAFLRFDNHLSLAEEADSSGTGGGGPRHAWDLVDASNMLWRFELVGFDVQHRWGPVVEGWMARRGKHASAVVDVHMAMAFAAAGRDELLEEHLGSMQRYAAAHWRLAPADADTVHGPADGVTLDEVLAGGAAAPVPFSSVPNPDAAEGFHSRVDDNRWATACVGLGVARGMAAYRRGLYDEAQPLLVGARHHAALLGGTSETADVIAQTAGHAATQSADMRLARALLSERTSVRPASLLAWNHYSSVLADLGEDDEAFEARERAYSLGLGQGGKNAN